MIAQQQNQKQSLKILPQQIQLLNLFFLNSMELEQRIKNGLEENPFLDCDETSSEEQEPATKDEDMQEYQDWEEVMYDDMPDYKTEYQNYFDSDVAPDTPIVNITTFKDEAH
ncbi:MAG: RNA polymerase sigma-54 factor, partial [Chitinophagia bacterium]|nr:RNA polymerase sigma-54 factor [Chitinophagia bacterium]